MMKVLLLLIFCGDLRTLGGGGISPSQKIPGINTARADIRLTLLTEQGLEKGLIGTAREVLMMSKMCQNRISLDFDGYFGCFNHHL